MEQLEIQSKITDLEKKAKNVNLPASAVTALEKMIDGLKAQIIVEPVVVVPEVVIPKEENDVVKALRKEIEDLGIIIEMEDDSEIIAKLKQEQADLEAIIQMELDSEDEGLVESEFKIGHKFKMGDEVVYINSIDALSNDFALYSVKDDSLVKFLPEKSLKNFIKKGTLVPVGLDSHPVQLADVSVVYDSVFHWANELFPTDVESKLKKSDIEKLVNVGYSQKQIETIYLGYHNTHEVKCDYEDMSNMFQYGEEYIDKIINEFVEVKEKKQFELGLKYPKFNWIPIIKKYKITSNPEYIETPNKLSFNKSGVYRYEIFSGENVIFSKLMRDDDDKIYDITLKFNNGYLAILSSKIEIIEDILNDIASQEGGYVKDVDIYRNSLSGVPVEKVAEAGIKFEKGGSVNTFISDEDKMYDFFELSKKDFLDSYSYLNEKEYDDTAIEVKKLKLKKSDFKPSESANGGKIYAKDWNLINDELFFNWDDEENYPTQVFYSKSENIYKSINDKTGTEYWKPKELTSDIKNKISEYTGFSESEITPSDIFMANQVEKYQEGGKITFPPIAQDTYFAKDKEGNEFQFVWSDDDKLFIKKDGKPFEVDVKDYKIFEKYQEGGGIEELPELTNEELSKFKEILNKYVAKDYFGTNELIEKKEQFRKKKAAEGDPMAIKTTKQEIVDMFRAMDYQSNLRALKTLKSFIEKGEHNKLKSRLRANQKLTIEYVEALTGKSLKGMTNQKQLDEFVDSLSVKTMGDGGRVTVSGMEERVKDYMEINLDEAKEIVKGLKWDKKAGDKLDGFYPENVYKVISHKKFYATFGGGYYVGEPMITLVTEDGIFIIPATEKEYEELISGKVPKRYGKGGKISDSDINELVSGYKQAILFTNSGEDEDSIDSELGIHDFNSKSDAIITKMAKQYIAENKDAIEKSGLDYEQIGMDVWYTQAGHGVGFGDRGISKDLVKKLEVGAKKFGDMSHHVFSQDGKVYVEGMKFPESYGKGGKIDSIEFKTSNLHLVGSDSDANGNKVVKVEFPNQRAFSIQTNGNLPETKNILKGRDSISELSEEDILLIEKEVNGYVKQFGSTKQKKFLKLYNKMEQGGDVGKSREFRYIKLEPVKGGLKISLTDDGLEEANEEGLDWQKFYDLFDDVQGNSEYVYLDDGGNSGFGLTQAPMILEGYYIDDEGEYKTDYPESAKVYYFGDYMVNDFAELLHKNGEVIFTETSN